MLSWQESLSYFDGNLHPNESLNRYDIRFARLLGFAPAPWYLLVGDINYLYIFEELSTSPGLRYLQLYCHYSDIGPKLELDPKSTRPPWCGDAIIWFWWHTELDTCVHVIPSGLWKPRVWRLPTAGIVCMEGNHKDFRCTSWRWLCFKQDSSHLRKTIISVDALIIAR